MIAELTALVRALGRYLPPDLAAIAAELLRTPWTEIATSWSLLTPTGGPIEVTVSSRDSRHVLAWTCEIAGPEVAHSERVDRVAAKLVLTDQPVPEHLLQVLRSAQRGCELRFGAWLGGRSAERQPTRFKVYCELPSGLSLQSLPLPERLLDAAASCPDGTLCRMVGIEPSRGRVELYFRLPFVAADQLRPLALAAGQPHAIDALRTALPDGLRRLQGRRLGASVAEDRTGAVELALFASARTMFPGAAEMLQRLIPDISRVPASLARPTLVTMRVDASDEQVSFAAGLALFPRQR